MHKSRQATGILRGLLAFTLLLAGVFSQSAPAEEITGHLTDKPEIAIILPLSGPFADLGRNFKQGFELGFAQGKELTPERRQFNPAFFDCAGSPEKARALIESLRNRDETLIAAGTPINTTAWTAGRACEKNGLPYLIIGADQDDLINENSVFSFRLTPSRATKEAMLAAFIEAQVPPVQSLAIIFDESPCTIHQARRLRKLCADKNIDLALWETYRDNESNFYDLLNLIKERQPRMLFLATSPAHSDKLWQQGERLQLLPPITIAMAESEGVSGGDNADSVNPLARPQLLNLTTWPPPVDMETPPLPENEIQAQGFAAAELILKTLHETIDRTHNQGLDMTSEEIIKTLENTAITTVYGQVSFSGPGLGHQNPQSWYLCSRDETGTFQIVFPQMPDSEKTTPTGEITPKEEKKRSPAEAQ